MATTEDQSTPPAPVKEPTPADRLRQQRQTAVYGVIGFLVVVFLFLVAFGGPDADPGPARHDLASLEGKGVQYAVDQVNESTGWEEALPYDATGQDRSLRDRRDWQVCFQYPEAAQGIDDKGEPQRAIDDHETRGAHDVWLGAVRTDEDCAKLGGDFGKVERVYDRDGNDGTDVVPNLYGFTAHMARVAFGDDASIRVRAIPDPAEDGDDDRSVVDRIREEISEDKAIKADDADEVGSGWDHWKVCGQNPPAGEAWEGRVINLDVVRYDETCREP